MIIQSSFKKAERQLNTQHCRMIVMSITCGMMRIITELLMELNNQISLVDTNNTFTQQHPTAVPSALQFTNFPPPQVIVANFTEPGTNGPDPSTGAVHDRGWQTRKRTAHSLAHSRRSQPRSADPEPPGNRGRTAVETACCAGRAVRNSPREQVGCSRSFTLPAPSSPAAYRGTFLIIILSIILLYFSRSQHTPSSLLKAPPTRRPALTRFPGAR